MRCLTGISLLLVLLINFTITNVAFSELICERPDGCRWIGNTCQDCIRKSLTPPTPKPEHKVNESSTPSKIIHNNYEIHIHQKVIQKEYIVTRPPSIQFSNPFVILSGLSRDSQGWRFRARVGSYECLMPPLRPGDRSGVFSCGGTPTNYFVFF